MAGMASRIYRVVRWIVLILLVGSIGLVLRKAPPPAVDTNPAAKETLREKLVEEQEASDKKLPHALKMNEAELNSMLASNLQLASAAPTAAKAPAGSKEPTLEEVQSSVRDVKVALLEDGIRAYVLFAFHGADLSLQLEGQLGVRDGHLRFTPSGGRLGSLPLPQVALDNAVTRLFDSPDNAEKFRVPPEVSDIRVEKYQLTVTYR
jgi:hypothetical protein